MKNKNLKFAVKVGILAAIAAVVQFVEFPLFFAPNFYKLDFSEIPALIGAFALGPWAGVLIELIKNLLHILIKGSQTAFVGEFANFITGCAMVVPASLFYGHCRTFRRALGGMAIGGGSFVLAGCALNYWVLIPAYSSFFHLPLDKIIEMGHAVNPAITDLKMLIILAVVPFNLLKAVLVCAATLLLYKHVSKPLKL